MKAMYKQGNAEDAVTQAASALKNSTFIVYCADDRNFAAITTKLHELMPETNMIGTTGFMLEDNGSFAEGIAAVGFEKGETEVYVGTIQDAPTCPISHLPEFRNSVEKIHAKYKDKDALCLEFATGYEEKMICHRIRRENGFHNENLPGTGWYAAFGRNLRQHRRRTA